MCCIYEGDPFGAPRWAKPIASNEGNVTGALNLLVAALVEWVREQRAVEAFERARQELATRGLVAKGTSAPPA